MGTITVIGVVGISIPTIAVLLSKIMKNQEKEKTRLFHKTGRVENVIKDCYRDLGCRSEKDVKEDIERLKDQLDGLGCFYQDGDKFNELKSHIEEDLTEYWKNNSGDQLTHKLEERLEEFNSLL